MHLEEVLSNHRDCQCQKLNNSLKVKMETCQKIGLLGGKKGGHPERRK